MKKSLIILPFISFQVLVIVSFGFIIPTKKGMKPAIPTKSFAVVELFTSEGCSSCPPADEAVAALAKNYPSNVFVLGFHVDYWNYLGWKDEFSTADYAKRQEKYAAAFQINSIYTPQVVINGKTEFTGSDKTRLYSAVDKELEGDNSAVIELTAIKGATNEVAVTYKTNGGDQNIVCIALVQLQAVSAVKRGENKGKLLHHIDVVRDFKTMDNSAGAARLILPEGVAAKDCKLVAFIQDKKDLHIGGAAETLIK